MNPYNSRYNPYHNRGRFNQRNMQPNYWNPNNYRGQQQFRGQQFRGQPRYGQARQMEMMRGGRGRGQPQRARQRPNRGRAPKPPKPKPPKPPKPKPPKPKPPKPKPKPSTATEADKFKKGFGNLSKAKQKEIMAELLKLRSDARSDAPPEDKKKPKKPVPKPPKAIDIENIDEEANLRRNKPKKRAKRKASKKAMEKIVEQAENWYDMPEMKTISKQGLDDHYKMVNLKNRKFDRYRGVQKYKGKYYVFEPFYDYEKNQNDYSRKIYLTNDRPVKKQSAEGGYYLEYVYDDDINDKDVVSFTSFADAFMKHALTMGKINTDEPSWQKYTDLMRKSLIRKNPKKTADPTAGKTIPQLKKLARDNNIYIPSGIRKAAIVKLIKKIPGQKKAQTCTSTSTC